MNIHEYQAKAVLAKYGVPVAKGIPAFTAEEAVKAAKELGGPIWVVKAQIHAGGRGKAGGVKVVKSIEEVEAEAKRMLGLTLVTHQTGPEGKEVKRLYIEDGSAIERELYLSCLVDRATGRVAFIASTEGGMDIEEVAAESPEKILTFSVDPASGVSGFHGRRVAFALGLKGDQVKQCTALIQNLYKAFVDADMSMLEINPLIVNKDGDLLCLDAKVNFDDNALYRHKDLAELRDLDEEDPSEIEASKYDLNYVKLDGTIGCMVNGDLLCLDAKVNFDDNALYRHKDLAELRDLDEEDPSEIEASKYDLNYVKLDGTIGCMVNGAGLAMATMDIIKLYGEEPANFLDVGGGATKEKVTAAFKIILSDPNVNGILVNIFGGIMRCDIIAEGVVAAAKEVSLNVPLVVRLEGTNVDLGKKIMAESGLPIISADNLADAADKITKAVKEAA